MVVRKTRKLQIKAMNVALSNFAEVSSNKEGLRSSYKAKVQNNLKYQEPYTSMEVYKSNSIYKTMNTAGVNIKKDINSLLDSE